uniref:Uncharacterized protein n=1 Tax=Romanomermis culicivorax TaxID=13658 RepID=A0A915I180_ROMCU
MIMPTSSCRKMECHWPQDRIAKNFEQQLFRATANSDAKSSTANVKTTKTSSEEDNLDIKHTAPKIPAFRDKA